MATAEQWRQYRDAKKNYEEALEQYESDMLDWSLMSPYERYQMHCQAEQESLALWSLAAAAGVSFFTYRYLQGRFEGNVFWIIFGVITVGVAFLFILLSSIVGRVMRGLFKALLWMIAAFVMIWLFGLVSSSTLTKTQEYVILGAGAFIGILYECLGRHHASAAPVMPREPSPPE